MDKPRDSEDRKKEKMSLDFIQKQLQERAEHIQKRETAFKNVELSSSEAMKSCIEHVQKISKQTPQSAFEGRLNDLEVEFTQFQYIMVKNTLESERQHLQTAKDLQDVLGIFVVLLKVLPNVKEQQSVIQAMSDFMNKHDPTLTELNGLLQEKLKKYREDKKNHV